MEIDRTPLPLSPNRALGAHHYRLRTGKPVRKMYKVPKHLDPRLEDDWTHRPENNNMDGEIIVCWEGKGLPRDIIFEGNPTPGMLPLDDEAKEVSSHFSWTPTQGIDEDSSARASTPDLAIP